MDPEEKLSPDRSSDSLEEKTLWTGSYSPQAMLGGWIIDGLITTAAVIVCLFFPLPMVIAAAIGVAVLSWVYVAGVLMYRRMSISYELTNFRFLHRRGILTRRNDRIEVIDIDDVSHTQSLWERIVGVGTIRISSSDRTDPELVLKGIDDVENVADLIDKTRREERRKRGLHIEAI